jgi:hypothetical protein
MGVGLLDSTPTGRISLIYCDAAGQRGRGG